MKLHSLLLALCLMFALTSCTYANESENNANKPESAAAAKEAELPAVPENGTLNDYKLYIEKLNLALIQKAQIVTDQTGKDGKCAQSEDAVNSLKEIFRRLELATDKALLLKDVSDEEYEKLFFGKISLIQCIANWFNDSETVFTSKMDALAALLHKAGKVKLAHSVETQVMPYKVLNCIKNNNVKEFAKLAAEVDKKIEIAGKNITPDLAKQAALILAGDKELSNKKTLKNRKKKYSKAFAEASDPAVREMDIDYKYISNSKDKKKPDCFIGKKFKFSGKFTDGSKYNAKNYSGKVVLFYFWSPCYSPCIRELANVKKMYAAYHNKGFEVIGVTYELPDDEFKDFLDDNGIVWKQIYNQKAVVPEKKGNSSKPVRVSDYYGITVLPCLTLIGKDGKIITFNARGEELKNQLVKIYGEVEGLDADQNARELDKIVEEVKKPTTELVAKDKPQAAKAPLPPVPQNATYEELEEYVDNLVKTARKEGINLHSDEFKDSQKERAKEYCNLIIQALDEELLLKDVDDYEYESFFNAKIEILGILAKLNNDNEEAVNAKLNAFINQLRQANKASYADLVEFKIVKGNLEKLIYEMKEKATPILAKAKEDGIDEESPEFTQLLKGIADEYLGPVEQLIDKALLLKPKPDSEFSDMLSEKFSILTSRAHFQNEDISPDFSGMKPIIDQLRQMGRTECAYYVEIKVIDRRIITSRKHDEFAKAADDLDQMVEKEGKDISYELSEAVMHVFMYEDFHNYTVPEERLVKYANTLSRSPNRQIKHSGEILQVRAFNNKVDSLAENGKVEEFAKLAAEMDEKVEKAENDIGYVLASQAKAILLAGYTLPGYNAPEGREEKYVKAIMESSDSSVKHSVADDLEQELLKAKSQKKFYDTLGKEFKFGGTFTDGSQYKAEDYAGKVVLIDFWATWCGPCRRELPNVKKMYDAYHNKGFEVIGVTCDNPDEEEDFNKFLKKNDIPWKQMFDCKAVIPGEKDKDGEPIKVSDYYAIYGIPCPVLIGKDGKVISLDARGEELEQQLVKIYGEVEEEPAAPADQDE